MRRPNSRLAAACAFAVAMTAFTGSAFAGNGQGNDTAPGQQKKDEAAAAQAAPAAATATPAPATAQPEPQAAQSQSGHVPPGQAKKQQPATSAQSSISTQTGVKPSSTTTKWTHCTTGKSSAGSTTCTSSDNGHTPQPNADASKRYGNGKTAAQIAVSRGGIGVQLTGPGNSQPHKVTVCGKPNNKSGGVDVHAVKSYSNLGCTQTQTAATTHSCGTASTCSNSAASQAAVAPVTPAASPVVQSSAPATQSSPVTQSRGGVLGAQITLTPPRPARHGVLGAVTHLSGATLPFTGFPLWFAVVIALALILAGLALRRRGAPIRV